MLPMRLSYHPFTLAATKIHLVLHLLFRTNCPGDEQNSRSGHLATADHQGQKAGRLLLDIVANFTASAVIVSHILPFYHRNSQRISIAVIGRTELHMHCNNAKDEL